MFCSELSIYRGHLYPQISTIDKSLMAQFLPWELVTLSIQPPWLWSIYVCEHLCFISIHFVSTSKMWPKVLLCFTPFQFTGFLGTFSFLYSGSCIQNWKFTSYHIPWAVWYMHMQSLYIFCTVGIITVYKEISILQIKL